MLPRCFEIETDAIVSNGQLHVTIESERSDGQMARLAVCDGIPHGFLRNSEQAKRRFIADAAQLALGFAGHLDAVLLFDFETVRVEGASKTHMPQRGGVQVVRESADTIHQPERTALQYGQRLLRSNVLNAAAPPFEIAHRDGDAGKFLADVVVKIACDSRACRLLSVDDTPRELSDAFVACSERSVGGAIAFLGSAPARMLSHQPTDEQGLDDEQGECADDVPAVQLPSGRVLEPDHGSSRKAGRIDAPPPQLPPIEGGYEPVVFHRDVLSTCAV